jgi:hypothetical protein
MSGLQKKDKQITQPKMYEGFIIKVSPFVVVVEIIFLIGIFLLTFPGRLLLFEIWQIIGPWMEYILSEAPYNNLGNLVYLYIFGSPALYCNIFTGYENCSAPILYCNFTTYTFCSVVGTTGWGNPPQMPSEYTKFINSLVEIIIPVIIAMKLFSVNWLFKQKKRDGIYSFTAL